MDDCKTPLATHRKNSCHPRRRVAFSLKSLFLFQAAAVALLLLAGWFRIIGIHYPRAVENNPLRSPVRVVALDGDLITLADGRKFQVVPMPDTLAESLRAPNDWIEVGPEVAQDIVTLTGVERGFICGTSWGAMISIPLIADDVPINHAVPLAYGRRIAGDTPAPAVSLPAKSAADDR